MNKLIASHAIKQTFVGLMVALLAIGCIASESLAQAKTSKINAAKLGKQLCLDKITVRGHKPFFGIVLRGNDQQVLVAVEREHYRESAPKEYAIAARDERQLAIQAWQDILDRTKTATEDLQTPDLLKGFLDRERQRIDERLSKASSPDLNELDFRFMWLDLKKQDIANITLATPQAKQVAMWAWNEELPKVHQRTFDDLKADLEIEKIDVTQPAPDLSEHLPPRPQSNDEWTKRWALIQYTFGKPVDYQGALGTFTKAQPNQVGAIFDLAGAISNIQSVSLDEILNPSAKRNSSGFKSDLDAFSSVTSSCEKNNEDYCRVTDLKMTSSEQAGHVRVVWLVKLKGRGWSMVWNHNEPLQESLVTAQQIETLKQDPNIKTVLQLFSLLGTASPANENLALRTGAAVQTAQQTAQGKFQLYRDLYAKRLDGPVIFD